MLPPRKYKRLYDYDSLVVGRLYYVECDIWRAVALYCGHVINDKEYTFTMGDDVHSWRNQFNISAPKSRLKVFELLFD